MIKTVMNSIQSFFKMEGQSSIILGLSVVLALIFANTEALQHTYHAIVHSPFNFEMFGFSIIGKDLHYLVNDGFMAIFFFLIGLEVKREFLHGELSNPANVMLPGLAAVGGLLVPCGIYFYFNQGLPTQSGWAVPGATDIAFAFGLITLFGNRIPTSLKTFILMLAIFDDVMVVGIIAAFFTENISLTYLLGAFISCLILAAMNYKNVSNFAPFAIVGFVLWYFTLKSGVHATIAGILLAAFIPAKSRKVYDEHNDVCLKRPSMLEELEHSLHEFVSFGVLPLFAFLNAGIAISMNDFGNLGSPESLGIIVGLFIGKQIGIFGVAYLLIKSGVCKMPEGANFAQVYGVAILCGIGFTMGLFIGDLAFKGMDVDFKLPILIGSLLSAVVGAVILHLSSPKKSEVKATA
jgi:NhaA family Na+:H+ antiporter